MIFLWLRINLIFLKERMFHYYTRDGSSLTDLESVKEIEMCKSLSFFYALLNIFCYEDKALK